MDSPSKIYTAILYCLVLTVVQSFGKLVMLHHPHTDHQTRDLTCLSEDDGAALIWTHGHNRQPVNIEDFKPNRPEIGKVGECAISGKSTCLAKWNKTSDCDWKVVNSAIKPTGPISDHRWEGFKEYRFPRPVARQDYQYVKEVDGSSGTVIFSVRGSNDVYIFMCKQKEPAQGPCIWIIFAAWGGKTSKVVSCVNGAAPPYHQTMSQKCKTVAEFKHGLTDVIDMYEWRTFRVKLNRDQGTIAIYKIEDRESFIKGIISPWYDVSHVSVRSDPTSRIRFHFHDYMMTEKTNAVISTGSIEHSNRIFCAELLLGLCPTCKLNVSLVDGDGGDIMTWNISGSEQDPYDGLLIWQSVRLIKELNSEGRDLLKIKIITVSGEEGGEGGQWAINNIRMCGSGKLRESKITLDAGNSDPVACQKLSYADNAIVKYVSPRNSDVANVLSELQELLGQRSGKIVGKNGFICNRGGCICDRGYKGSDCAHECSNGFYGFNCKKKCGFCQYSENCVKSTGFCEAGCLGDRIAPFCKTAIGAPTINDVRDTTATLLQSIVIDDDELDDVTVQIQEAKDESWVNFPAKVTDSHHIRPKTNYAAYLTGMKPNTFYTVRTVVSVKISEKITLTFGPKYNFSTTPLEESTLVAVPNEISLTVQTRNEESEIDSDPDHRYSILVTDTLTNNVTFSASATSFPFNITGLTPFTEYKVKIIDTITQRTLLDTELRTLESAPSEIRGLRASFISDTNVTFRWHPPSKKNGIIRNYSVSLKLNELRGCKDLNETTPYQEEIVRIATETTVVFSGLHPYAEYTASVIPHNSKPGPSATLRFETKFTMIPTSKVSNPRMREDGGHVEWDKPADCTTITGPTEVTRLFIIRISDLASQVEYQTGYSSFDLSGLSLEPFTSYKVRLHVIRGYDEPENPDVYQELIWRTDLANLEDPTIVDVTDSTAKIIQNFKYTGPDGESFVIFILREVWSNRSLALLPTNATAVEHELDLKNLKPNTLYNIHTLVTMLAPEGPLTVDSSPVIFKTKCSDVPQFEVSPGDGNLTIHMLSLPEDCEHPTDQLYSVKVYDTAEESLITSLALRSFPLIILDLEPYSEYEVNVWIRLRLVFTRKIRASGSNETSLPSVN